MIATTEQPVLAPAQGVGVEFDVQMRAIDVYRADCAITWRQLRKFLAICTGIVLLRAVIQQSLFILVFVGFVSLVCFAIYSAFIYLGARSNLRTSKVLSSRIHYSYSPCGLRSSTPTHWGDQSWGNIHELVETRHLLILRSSSAQKTVIPKRCLAAGQAGQIRNFVNQRETLKMQYVRGEHPAAAPLVTATVRMTAEDLYWGFLTMLLRKSHWYAAQFVFSFALIFLLNPHLLSPLAFVTVGAIFFLYVSIAMYMTSSRAVRTNAAYQHEMQFAFCETGLEGFGPTLAFHQDWQNYQSVIETSRAFLFCPSNSRMLVIPKRALTEGAKIETLRILLKTHYHGKLSLKS
jgi:hypothetical protein